MPLNCRPPHLDPYAVVAGTLPAAIPGECIGQDSIPRPVGKDITPNLGWTSTLFIKVAADDPTMMVVAGGGEREDEDEA